MIDQIITEGGLHLTEGIITCCDEEYLKKSLKIGASPELLTLKEIANPLVWKKDECSVFGGEWVCPRCGSEVTVQVLREYGGEYCQDCGQKIVTYDDVRDFADAYPSRGLENP